MKQEEIVKNLEKYPVFDLKIVREIIEKDSDYAKLVVHRLKKNKLISEIEKGRYSTNREPIVIASNIIWPSYISCWSALRYHNITEQLPQIISVMTTRKRKKKEVSLYGTKIVFTRIKPKYLFGYERKRYQNFNIFIANKEKALIDSALLKKISFSEICDIMRVNIKSVDIDLLVKYLLRIKNKTLIKRFGFLIDKLGIDKYDRFKEIIDFKYVPLDYAIPADGKRNKKWRVIDNVGL